MSSPASSFTCTYNAANQVKKQVFDDGRTNEYAYDAAYRLTSASSGGSTASATAYAYAYDALGNTTQVTCNLSPVTCTLGSAYDAASQRTNLQFSMGNLQLDNSYSYDALGRLVLVSNPFLSATYKYDEAGNLTGKVVNAQSQILNTQYRYDALDRLTNLASGLQLPASNAPIDSFAYRHETNRPLITFIRPATGPPQTFLYDAAGQLVVGSGRGFKCDAAGRIVSDIAFTNLFGNLLAFWSFDNANDVCHDDTGNGNNLHYWPPYTVPNDNLPPTVDATSHPHSLYTDYTYTPTEGNPAKLDATDFTFAGFFWRAHCEGNPWPFCFRNFDDYDRQRTNSWGINSYDSPLCNEHNCVTGVIETVRLTIATNSFDFLRERYGSFDPGSDCVGWHHFALTRSGSNFCAYANGQLMTSVVVNVGPLGNGTPIGLGWGGSENFDQVGYWGRALSDDEIFVLYHDAYPTNTGGFSLGTYQYDPGNKVGALGSYAVGTNANLDIVCRSPLDLTAWQVDANGIAPQQHAYHGTSTTFTVANVPLHATCAWAKVTLDGQPAESEGANGNCAWGMHQPATNQQIHFAVTPATQMAPGVFPVYPQTNTAYAYDPAGQVTANKHSGRTTTSDCGGTT